MVLTDTKSTGNRCCACRREPGRTRAEVRMVRRSTVDRSPQPTVYRAGSDAGTGDPAQGGGASRRYAAPGWRGAGGRWLVWTLRIVVWAGLLIIGYRGWMASVVNEAAPSPP